MARSRSSTATPLIVVNMGSTSVGTGNFFSFFAPAECEFSQSQGRSEITKLTSHEMSCHAP